MNKLLLTKLLVVIFSVSAYAQNYTITKISNDGIELKKYDKDEKAHAVVLDEHGEVRFLAGGLGHVMLTFEHHVRIKIFDEEGLKYAKVEIPLYNTDQRLMEETVDEVRAVTVYKDENGAIKSEQLSDFNIITVKKNRSNKVLKFELPKAKPGCVIDYTYRFTTPFLQNLHTWMFQSDLPKITSKFETFIPQFYTYNVMLRGSQKLAKNSSNRVMQCYIAGTLKSDCLHTYYEMNDIPAFVREENMTSPKNFMSAIYFEMTQFTDPYSSKNAQVAQNWEEIDSQFQKDDNFGGQLKKVDFLNTKIGPVITGLTDPLDKARAVFKYIQKNVKWDSVYATSSPAIRKALDKHTGDSGDINLLLVAALKAAGIPASAALVSTRDHGLINKEYPNPTAFDHVIAETTIADRTYLLDATDPSLPFGVLPMYCLNDKVRVLSADKPAHWIDPALNQNKNTTYLFNLTLQADGKLKGTLTSRFANHAAHQKRNEIKQFKTTNDYVENLGKTLTGLKISNSEINNLDSLDLALTESFDIEVNTANTTANTLAFNPYMINHMITNPFKAEERNYPLDLGLASDTKIIVNFTYPDSYIIENLPQSLALSLPEQGGRFSVTTQSNGNSFSLTNILSLKKPIYSVNEYQQLRELYDKIIEHEKPDLVLKKKI